MKVTLIDSLHAAFVEALEKNGAFEINDRSEIPSDAVVSVLADTEILVVRSKVQVTAALLDAAPKLKAIARAGAGIDNIDETACRQRGIALFNAPEGNRRAVAEHVLGMILALFNKIIPSHLAIAHHEKWKREASRGEELEGKIIGLIGCGHNGSETGQLLSRLGCTVLAYDKYRSEEDFPLGIQPATLEEIAQHAEVLSLHIPLTAETRAWVNQNFLQAFQQPFWLVNASRGGVLDWASLPALMDSGKIRGVALDVFEKEPPFGHAIFENLQKRPNVVFSPHVAGWTKESYQKISEILATKLIHFQKNGVLD